MQKMKNIEFLRVIAILAIVLLHFFHSRQGGILNSYVDVPLYNKLFKMTANGQKAVDFFFIVSGFFFYLGFVRFPDMSLGEFFKKKVIRLWPVMCFTVLLAGIFACFKLVNFAYWDNLNALLFLNGTTLVRFGGNLGAAWYCSALMFNFLLFFYLLKNFRRQTVWLIIAVGIYLSYTFVLRGNNYHLNNTDRLFAYIFNSRMTRAFGGIGIGIFIGLWYKTYEMRIRDYVPLLKTKVAISGVEFICLYFMINNLILHRFAYHNDFMYVIVFVLLIVTFVCNKGFISQWLNQDVFVYASRYVYSIFMTHMLILSVVKRGFWKMHRVFLEQYPVMNMVLALSLVILVGVLTYHLVEVKCKNYLTKKWFGK